MGMACNVADAGSTAVHAVGLRRGSRVQMCARYARPVWTVTQLLQHARPLRTLTLRDSDAFLKTLKYQGFELVSWSRKCQSPQRSGVLMSRKERHPLPQGEFAPFSGSASSLSKPVFGEQLVVEQRCIRFQRDAGKVHAQGLCNVFSEFTGTLLA